QLAKLRGSPWLRRRTAQVDRLVRRVQNSSIRFRKCRDWMARATAEIELSLKLSKKLEAADSVPDAVVACQEWLNEEMGARAEDARLLMSNGQKFTDATSRFLSSGWTNVGTTT